MAVSSDSDAAATRSTTDACDGVLGLFSYRSYRWVVACIFLMLGKLEACGGGTHERQTTDSIKWMMTGLAKPDAAKLGRVSMNIKHGDI